MEILARAGVFFLTLVVYVLVVLVISVIIATNVDPDYISWIAFGLGALAYAVTMMYKWTF